MPSSRNLGAPLWADGQTWTSLLQRQFAGGVAVWDTNASTTAVHPLGGVLHGPANPLAAAPLATPAMSVLVNAGYCAVPHPTQGHGVYLFGLTAQATLTVAANPSGSARTDIVIARVYDLGTSGSYADVEIISGTPGAGQPAVPGVAVLLGTVTVATGAVSIVAGNITDLRSFTVAPGGILPISGPAAPPLAPGQIVWDTVAGALKTVAPPVAYTQTFNTTTSWISPFTGILNAACIGAGGGGSGGFQDLSGQWETTQGGAGGGGGEWAAGPVAVTKGHSYPVNIGAGGFRGTGGTNDTGGSDPTVGVDGTATTFTGDTVTITANGGKGGGQSRASHPVPGGLGGSGSTAPQKQPGGTGGSGAWADAAAGGGGGQSRASHPVPGGLGGSGSTAPMEQPGGTGGSGAWADAAAGGGGGGSGSAGAPGGAGGNGNGNTPGAGGTAGPGGAPGTPGEGPDAAPAGGVLGWSPPGGGGGGGYADDWDYYEAGGPGADGQVTLTWSIQPAALTPVLTTITGDTTTPHEYLTLVNTDAGTGLTPGDNGSPYGWGIGYGSTGGYYHRRYGYYSGDADGSMAPQIQVTFNADGKTDYQIDVKWGMTVPEATVDSSSPNIPYGRCQIMVTLDGVLLDQVYLNCAAKSGVLYPGDAGSFTVYTSSQRGTTPKAGPHTVSLAIETQNTLSGQYSGAHVGDLASVGTSPYPFGGALPTGFTTALTAENAYLRVAGISASGT